MNNDIKQNIPTNIRIGSKVLDNTPDGAALFRALGGHYSSPAQAICELIDDGLSSIIANGDQGGRSVPPRGGV